MAPRVTEDQGRSGRWLAVIAVVLALVAILEAYLLQQQEIAHRVSTARSNELLASFLKSDTSAAEAAAGSIHIRLRNVRFKWSPRVWIETGEMALRAVPVHGGVCNFDDLESFRLTLQQSSVDIRPDVLAGMFNESVFNYPGARVRDLSVSIEPDDDDRNRIDRKNDPTPGTKQDGKDAKHDKDAKDARDAKHDRDEKDAKDDQKGKELIANGNSEGAKGPFVVLSGKANMIAWIPFKMYTRLGVDPKTNTMVISIDHLKIFGHLPATKLLHLAPFRLDKIVAIPPNQSLFVNGNEMMVKPFALFPPPRISGQLADVKVFPNFIRIGFAGAPVAAPKSDAKNYVYLSGGVCQFGKFRMEDTDVLIVDAKQSDIFSFSIAHYADMIKKSRIDVRELRSVAVVMPDD